MARKKKKLASNPARGYATVRIPPKSQAKDISDTEATEATETSSTREKGSTLGQDEPVPEAKGSLENLSPEELEKYLEEAELQILLDKYAAKCESEASRQAGKLETERRTLRAQAIELSIHDWLSPEICTSILEKGVKELQRLPSYFRIDEKASHTASEDDLLMNTWTLKQILLKAGFPEPRVTETLKEILLHYSDSFVSSKDASWNVGQAIEWLALRAGEEELPAFEQQSTPTKPDDKGDEMDLNPPSSGARTPVSIERKQKTKLATPAVIPNSDSESSDTDLEPDSLIPRFLNLRSQIYTLKPNYYNHSKAGSKKGTPNDKGSPVDRKIDKIKAKLSKIEKDILFDPEDAEAKWQDQLFDLRASTSESLCQKICTSADNLEPSPSKDAKPITQEGPGNDDTAQPSVLEDDIDEDMLGGMFATESISTMGNGTGDKNVVIKIRDFGKVSGASPRRILEETCRLRDSGSKLQYTNISSTPFSHRKAVEILWSKAQDSSPVIPLPDVSYYSEPRSVKASMDSVSAATAQQAEFYISVVALFVITSTQKDNKISMKLPGAWKDVWEELMKAKKEHDDSINKQSVRDLKDLMQQVKNQTDEDVVLTENFRQRNENGSGRAESEKNSEPKNPPSQSLEKHYQALWADRSATASFKQMMKTRMTLPIWPFRERIIEMLANNRTLIICSETGSGKSTQIPSFILEYELKAGRACKIYVTEPRRISAISLARRVSEELGEVQGAVGTSTSLVGYAIRLETKVTMATKLVYATTGVVIRMLERPQNFKDITHLVLDEVHERSLDGDFLLIVLRRLLQQREDLKLILMSATVDAKRFSSYLDNAPILDIPGRTFPVETNFLEDAIELTRHCSQEVDDLTDDSDASSDKASHQEEGLRSTLSNYSKQTRDAVCSFDEYRLDYKLIIDIIHTVATTPKLVRYSSAFLVFMPGLAEIRKLQDRILTDDYFNGWTVHALHSSIASEDQEKAFIVPPKGTRKIVIATNIAETGITIPDITVVIDAGKEKVMRFDERRQISRLTETFISRANAKQRRGRAGRVQEGLCFHLFTKHRHDTLLADQQTPEMLRLSLQDLILRVKICNLGGIEETLSEALDSPSAKNIRRAIEALKAVKALTGSEALTPLGRQLAQLPLDVFLGKLVLYGALFQCVDAAVSIAAILSCKSPFINKPGSGSQTRAAKREFGRGNSDLLSVYNAYRAWTRCRDSPVINEFTFCRKNCLSPQALANIEDVKIQLLVSLFDTGLLKLDSSEEAALSRARFSRNRRQYFAVPERLVINSSNDIFVNSVIAWSFYPRILTRHGKGWRNISNNQAVVLHATSVNKNVDPSIKWLSYYHIMQSQNRNYNAHETSAVEDFCLALLCGDVEFKLYSGVVLIDGNRLRFLVKDWKSMVALKLLSSSVREILAQIFRNPRKELTADQKGWLDIFQQIFTKQREKRSEKAQQK